MRGTKEIALGFTAATIGLLIYGATNGDYKPPVEPTRIPLPSPTEQIFPTPSPIATTEPKPTPTEIPTNVKRIIESPDFKTWVEQKASLQNWTTVTIVDYGDEFATGTVLSEDGVMVRKGPDQYSSALPVGLQRGAGKQ